MQVFFTSLQSRYRATFKCLKKCLSALGFKQIKAVKLTGRQFQVHLCHGWHICADRPKGLKPNSALDAFSLCPDSLPGA